MNEAALWNEALDRLLYHSTKRRHTPLQTLNRLFLEHFQGGAPPGFELNQQTCRARKEHWNTEQLQSIRQPVDKEPAREGLPLLVVEHNDRLYRIDGNKRINKLVRERQGSEVILLRVVHTDG